MNQADVAEWTTANLVVAYAKYVGWIDRGEDNWETFAWEALFIRDDLAERWEQLTEAERETVRSADEMLVANHTRMAESILPAPVRHPPSAWWWFLDLGPDVRDTEVLRGRLRVLGELE